MYYQVFVDCAYIRDAQGYLAGEVDENSEYLIGDDGWEDVSGDALVIAREFESLKELKKCIKQWYPDMDFEVLQVYELPSAPKMVNIEQI
nr:hypothetical protein [uncultured Lachnoclostridium sp.]